MCWGGGGTHAGPAGMCRAWEPQSPYRSWQRATRVRNTSTCVCWWDVSTALPSHPAPLRYLQEVVTTMQKWWHHWGTISWQHRSAGRDVRAAKMPRGRAARGNSAYLQLYPRCRAPQNELLADQRWEGCCSTASHEVLCLSWCDITLPKRLGNCAAGCHVSVPGSYLNPSKQYSGKITRSLKYTEKWSWRLFGGCQRLTCNLRRAVLSGMVHPATLGASRRALAGNGRRQGED